MKRFLCARETEKRLNTIFWYPGFHQKRKRITMGVEKTNTKKSTTEQRVRKSVLKKPRSSWNIFSTQTRSQMSEEDRKSQSFADLCKKLAVQWSEMSGDDKAPFVKMHEADKERYHNEFSLLSDEEKEGLKRRKKNKKREDDEADEPSKKRRKKRTKKVPKFPKPVKSPYMHFAKNVRPRVVLDDPTLSFQEIGRELGRRWKSLDAEGRKVYDDLHAEDKIRFLREKEEGPPPTADNDMEIPI